MNKPVWNCWSPRTESEGEGSMDLPTSLTGIGVRGVKVLPTQAKTKNKHKQRHANIKQTKNKQISKSKQILRK